MTKLSPLQEEHRHEVMAIFNYYIENSFAAYPEEQLPPSFFDEFLKMTQGHPAYVLEENKRVVGFAFLRPYKPYSTFSETAEITYFIHPDFTGKGTGALLLKQLQEDAIIAGLSAIFASIVSENTQSMQFHEKNGFVRVGVLPGIGKKFGKPFDIVWMKKTL